VVVLAEHAPTFPVGRAPMSRIHLHPIAAIAGTIRCRPALRYYALELQALGSLEELQAIIEAFNQAQARHIGPGQRALETSPALGQWQRTKISAVAVQEVEGVHRELVLARSQCRDKAGEIRRAVAGEQYELAVDHRGATAATLAKRLAQSCAPRLKRRTRPSLTTCRWYPLSFGSCSEVSRLYGRSDRASHVVGGQRTSKRALGLRKGVPT
jgi:hypothetical protein